MAYDIDKLTRYRDVKDFVEKLNKKVEPITYNNAPAHNAIFRSKNLGTTVTAAQIQAIRNKTYEDIYCGDVWKLTLPTFGATDAYVWGCDILGGLVLGLVNPRFYFQMNNTANETHPNGEHTIGTGEGEAGMGHLKGSDMYNTYLPSVLADIESVIPPEYILTRVEFIGDAVRNPTVYPTNYDYFIRLKSHVSGSNNERIYLASPRNCAIDFSSLVEYKWADEHSEWLQQNVGWGIVNSLIFPYFIHRPFKASDYGSPFIGFSAFTYMNNYHQVSTGSNFKAKWLPFVMLG